MSWILILSVNCVILSSVIHRPLKWDPLFWPHARSQPEKLFSFDHESQVGYIPGLNLLYCWFLEIAVNLSKFMTKE